ARLVGDAQPGSARHERRRELLDRRALRRVQQRGAPVRGIALRAGRGLELVEVHEVLRLLAGRVEARPLSLKAVHEPGAGQLAARVAAEVATDVVERGLREVGRSGVGDVVGDARVAGDVAEYQ